MRAVQVRGYTVSLCGRCRRGPGGGSLGILGGGHDASRHSCRVFGCSGRRGGQTSGAGGTRHALNSIIRVETVSVELTPEEYLTIFRGLEETFNFERKKTAWKCVDYNEWLLPPFPHVAIDVLIGEAVREPGGLAMLVTVTVRGQGYRERLRVVPAARLDPDDRGPTLRGEAQAALIESLNTFAPCKAKVKMKGKYRQVGGAYELERTLAGEGELVLNENGAFELMMTIPDAFVLKTFGPLQCQLTEQGGTCQIGEVEVMCTFTYQPLPARWMFSGAYQAETGTLVFASIASEGGGHQGGGQCCAPVAGCVPSTGDVPPPPWAASLPLGGTEVAVALADGATFSIPPPPGLPGDWEVTLTLEYGGESAEDVAGTPIAGLTP